MRIALLGADDVTLAVAAAAVRSREHQVVQAAEVAGHAAELSKLIPGLRIDDNWERLLDSNAIDAVVLAADQPAARVEQLRRLIQLGMPTLVSHPVSLSMLECYELEMIRRETGCVVLPYLPARWHPAAAQLQRLVADRENSGIEQIVFHRSMPRRDRETVLRQFAVDVDLLQFIAGDATKLHAHGSPGSDAHSNLAVQLTCENGLVCRWLVGPVEDEPAGEITLIGPDGKANVSMPDRGAPWHLDLRFPHGSHSTEFPQWDAPAAALEKLTAARAGQEVDPTWAQAARTVELAETIDTSLARGRTIDLHREEFTDIGTFKGTMASLGCGLLMAGLVLVVFVATVRVLAVQAGWNGLVQILDFWPYLLLAVLGIFLVLQLLVLIGKSPKLPNRQGDPDRQSAADRHDFSP